MLRSAVLLVGAIGAASIVRAGVVVDLVPDNPGPYTGGESLTVDVWLTSDVQFDVLLRLIKFDFSDTDTELSLDSEFSFDFSALPGENHYMTFPELPVPWTAMTLDCGCPSYYIPLSAEGSLRIGSLAVELPSDVGVYRMDTLNADEPDELLGAKILALYPHLNPLPAWRAYTGEITGGAYDFVVVPEPATVLLILGGTLSLVLIAHRKGRGRRSLVLGACLLVGPLGMYSSVGAQPAPVPGDRVALNVDSGLVSPPGRGSDPVVVFSQLVSVQDARWLRLHFSHADLTGSPSDGNDSFLRITAQEDGAVQVLDSSALVTWAGTSAYFNGGSVLVELVAYPGTGENRVAIDTVAAGAQAGSGSGDAPGGEGDCQVDDRTLSDDPRAGRFFFFEIFDPQNPGPAVCSSFLLNTGSNCLLTAGHCCDGVDYQNEKFPPLVEFNGWVTQGGCPPRVPTDPYVHTLVHTVPQSMASLRATH